MGASPSCTPDAARLLYSSTRGVQVDLGSSATDGTAQTRITTGTRNRGNSFMEAAVHPTSVHALSRLVVIGAMVAAVVAHGFYLWAGTLTIWLGPGVSPTTDEGLFIARTTSVVLVLIAVGVMVVARARAIAVTMCVCALLFLINYGLWLAIGIPGSIAVVVLGCVWLARTRGIAQPT
jgi:hypothetical protein